MTHNLIKTDNYLLVLEHSRIKRGDTVKYDNGYFTATHDNYHDSLMKIIAHLPLNGSPILEGVDLLPPYSRHQEDGVEEAEKAFTEVLDSETKQVYDKILLDATEHGFIVGYNKAREKYKYTEKDIRKAIDMATTSKHDSTLIFFNAEEIIQHLHQYPTEFECEMEYYYHSSPKYYHDAGFVKCDESQYNIIRKTIPECETKIEPKTIITAQGVQWVGKYK